MDFFPFSTRWPSTVTAPKKYEQTTEGTHRAYCGSSEMRRLMAGMELPGIHGGDRHGLVGQVLPRLGGIDQELEAPAARRLLKLPDQLGVGLGSALRSEVGRRTPEKGQDEGNPRPAAPAQLTGHYLALRAA
jgi:hypothetical protein